MPNIKSPFNDVLDQFIQVILTYHSKHCPESKTPTVLELSELEPEKLKSTLNTLVQDMLKKNATQASFYNYMLLQLIEFKTIIHTHRYFDKDAVTKLTEDFERFLINCYELTQMSSKNNLTLTTEPKKLVSYGFKREGLILNSLCCTGQLIESTLQRIDIADPRSQIGKNCILKLINLHQLYKSDSQLRKLVEMHSMLLHENRYLSETNKKLTLEVNKLETEKQRLSDENTRLKEQISIPRNDFRQIQSVDTANDNFGFFQNATKRLFSGKQPQPPHEIQSKVNYPYGIHESID